MVWDKQVYFNDPMTDNMKYMILYHGCVMTVCAVVMGVVVSGYMRLFLFWYNEETFCNHYTKNDLVETMWTAIPIVFLIGLAIPSLNLLYFSGKNPGAEYKLNLKVIGNQWYWVYEYHYSGYKEPASFSSYKLEVTEDTMDMGLFVYLDVDKRCVLPVNTLIRVLYTSADVNHSWFIPGFGFKNDCIPGRIGSSSLVINDVGVSYGSCAELCGEHHSQMPIVVESVPEDVFYVWLSSFFKDEEDVSASDSLLEASLVESEVGEKGVGSFGNEELLDLGGAGEVLVNEEGVSSEEAGVELPTSSSEDEESSISFGDGKVA